MFYSIRVKLIVSLLGVSILVGGISLFIGSQLLYTAVLNEATRRISLDLNTARDIYQSEIQKINTALTIAALDHEFKTAIHKKNKAALSNKLKKVAQLINLDFAGVASGDREILYKIGTSEHDDSLQTINPIVSQVLNKGAATSGTVILEQEFLLAEDSVLAKKACIPILSTPMAAPRNENEEVFGMALAAGVPVYNGNELAAILYGGILLNRNTKIVDRVKETVFQNEIYKGQSIGTVTIFFKDLRISTNVLTPDGERAIGTRVSKEVRDWVFLKGTPWTDRAFVVSDWYITAYEPISDIKGDRVGMLYVGVLEKKYIDMRKNLLSVFILITIAGIVVAIGLGYFLTTKIIHPLRRLIQASSAVSEGNLEPEIGPISKDEIGILQDNFAQMLVSLKERTRRQRVESERQLLQSEKQAGIGRLAAGVAHEINNPLTGVLTFTHMLLRRTDINNEVRSDLETIAHETERVRKIVKGLLDFSHQATLTREKTDINKLVKSTIELIENEALVKGIDLQFKPKEGLPIHEVDRNQLQSVILNMIINAFDATDPGGKVTVSTDLTIAVNKKEQKGIEIAIADTGCGIQPENLDKLFDPFFTTKDVGRGTGLGLSVSFGIIEQHGGSIHVHSEVGKGSTFSIWLPLEQQYEV